MPNKQNYSYQYLGYVDYANHEYLKRAPGNKPPRETEMTQEWQDYYDGYFSAGGEKLAQINGRRRTA